MKKDKPILHVWNVQLRCGSFRIVAITAEVAILKARSIAKPPVGMMSSLELIGLERDEDVDAVAQSKAG